ncbi:SMP-30/gluconolactonase/LRE family protein [Streptomyces sp. WAC05292]|uniref:SMP-30/gluconolactonase/LRE family protein n=1 Tax=Streptomyces sp. WAC05292 TaxID=2487418 RepID=UPI0021B00F9C|nr:SMP-30/gluconolactonase/LRE family protein [Streptomyces sp. WAC05292]
MKLSQRTKKNLPAVVLLALAASMTAGTGPAAAAPVGPSATHTAAPHARISTAFTLPGERVYPEGIAADPRTGTVYVGSYADGTVYRTLPGRSRAEVFLPAGTDGRRTANGLRVDDRGRLWVTDSTAGVTVYDTRSGTRLARFDVPGSTPHFVNDVAITPDGTAYLTDSIRAVVYRVTRSQLATGGGVLHPAYDLTAELTPIPDRRFSLNGITADPRGRHLLTVDMITGELFRIDLRSGAITRVALEGGNLLNGDGIDLAADGTLRVVHNTTNTLTRWRTNGDGTRARLTRTLTDQSLQIPTTLTHTRGRTLVVRSQFDKGGPAGDNGAPAPFTVAEVRGF